MDGRRFIIVTLSCVILGAIVGIGHAVSSWPPSPAGPMGGVKAAMSTTRGTVGVFGLSWSYSTRWGMAASYAALWSVNGLMGGLFVASIDQAGLLTWRLLRGGRQREQQDTE